MCVYINSLLPLHGGAAAGMVHLLFLGKEYLELFSSLQEGMALPTDALLHSFSMYLV